GILVSVVPGGARPQTVLPGTAEHFVAYFAAGLLLSAGYRGRVSAGVIALLLVFGAGALEAVQYLVPGRYAGWRDFAASAAGAVTGAAAARAVAALLQWIAARTLASKE